MLLLFVVFLLGKGSFVSEVCMKLINKTYKSQIRDKEIGIHQEIIELKISCQCCKKRNLFCLFEFRYRMEG